MSVFRVVEPFAYQAADGSTRVMRVGDVVDAGDPCLKGRAGLFEPVEATVQRARDVAANLSDFGAVVEQATAAPGEKRARRTSKSETGE